MALNLTQPFYEVPIGTLTKGNTDLNMGACKFMLDPDHNHPYNLDRDNMVNFLTVVGNQLLEKIQIYYTSL